MTELFATHNLDDYLRLIEDERELDGLWHPSSLSSPCVRRAVLEKIRVPFSNPPTKATKRIFKLGHLIHELVQDALKSSPALSAVEVEVEVADTEMELEGSADAVVRYKDTGIVELVEVKTTSEAALRYALPKKEHYMQAASYAYYIQPDQVRFVYITRDKMLIKEVVVEHTKEMDRDFLERMYILAQAQDRYEKTGEWAKYARLMPSDNWFSAYCPYKGSGKCCVD